MAELSERARRRLLGQIMLSFSAERTARKRSAVDDQRSVAAHGVARARLAREKIRSAAMASCTVTNWGFNFIVSFTFLQLISTAGKGGAFFTYAALGVAAIVFFAWKVPETKGRSLEEIEHDLGAEDAPVSRDRADSREHARA